MLYLQVIEHAEELKVVTEADFGNSSHQQPSANGFVPTQNGALTDNTSISVAPNGTTVVTTTHSANMMQQPAPLANGTSDGDSQQSGTPAADGQANVAQGDGPKPLLEAMLSQEMAHPNVIKTYKYATRPAKVSSQSRRYSFVYIILVVI